MHRILITFSAAAALTCAAVYLARPNQALAQSKSKAQAAKAALPPSYGNADAITADELKVYDYFLASDELEGRNFPSRGYDTAALYVASHLAEWGLKPGGSTSETNGPLQPYFMPIELVTRSITPEESKATLTAPAGRGGRGFAGGGGGGGGRAGNGENAPDQTTSFEYGKDWTMAAAGGRGGPAVAPLDVTGNLVFAGNGYVIKKGDVNPYNGIDVKGKIIVVAGLPAELAAAQGGGNGAGGGRGRGGRGGAGNAADQPAGAQPGGPQPAAAANAGGRGAAAANPLGEACTDFWTPEQYGAKNGALAVVTIANFQQLTALSNAGRGGAAGGRGGVNGPNYQVKKFAQTPACAAVPAVTAGIELTNALFAGEKESAQQVFYGAGSNAKIDSFDLNARKKLNLKVAVHSQDGRSENIVGMLEGSDPALKNEFVVMSAHLDHIGLAAVANSLGHNVNNGADDDGSGSTALLGLAHAYAEGAAKGIRPKRSIIFLWNGGEEKGLLGSQYFAEFPPIDITKVVADLNIDMIGRTLNPNSVDNDPTHVLVKQGEILLIGPNISSDDLGKTIDTVNANYQKLKIDHFYDTTAPDAEHDNKGPQPNGQRIFYRSDHYNFAKVGVPIAFFTTGLHVDYHRPTDTPEKIDFKEMQIVTRTVAAVGWELANQAGRPQLKPNLPEQLVKDMKTAKEQGWGKLTPVLPPLPGEPY
jgi:Zn-dependent M28 family amino/carboxypeptidase